MSRALFAVGAFEEILHCLGEGMNGKGVIVALISAFFGEHAEQIACEELTQEPPSGNNVSPAIYSWRGRRILMATESERGKRLHSACLKRLRDQATVLKARTLFKEGVSFNPTWLVMLASNVEITWTSKDGGIDCSYSCLPFPIKFGGRADPAQNIRRGDTRLKDPAFAVTMAPQLWYVLKLVFKIFLKDGVADTIVLPRPLEVCRATAEQLLDDMQEQLHSFLDEHIQATSNRLKASKTPVILRAFALHCRHSRGLDATAALDRKELADAEKFILRRATKVVASRGIRTSWRSSTHPAAGFD